MSVETLEAAIARLEDKKRRARPLPWEVYTVPDERRIAGYTAIAADEQEMVVSRYEGGFFDADLVVTLSRTVDPILSILRHAVKLMGSGLVGSDEAEMVRALELALAILGEVEHD